MAEFVAQGNTGNHMPGDYIVRIEDTRCILHGNQGTLVTGGNFAAIRAQQWHGIACGTRES